MAENDQLDASDLRLAEEFRAQIEASGSRTAFDGEPAGTATDQPPESRTDHGQDLDDAPLSRGPRLRLRHERPASCQARG